MATGVRPAPPSGPRDRLPRPDAQVNRGREVRLGLLGVVALLVLLIGIPVALVLFVGYPLPRTAPSQDWLTTPMTSTVILNALACVVWVVWAHFLVCVLSEWRAVRRGRLPSHVALGGGSQLLARRLVATVLLLAGAATAVPHGSAGSATPAPRPAITQQHIVAADPLEKHPSHLHALAPHHPTAAPVAQHHAAAAPATHETTTKYYVVQPPHGRRYDCLWDIAERTLGDPLRYKEIFALNKDRVQSDGRKLVDANLIQPGWELKLPADASGPGVHVVHASAPVRKPAPHSPTHTAGHPAAHTATHEAQAAGHASHAAADASTHAKSGHEATGLAITGPAAVRHAATHEAGTSLTSPTTDLTPAQLDQSVPAQSSTHHSSTSSLPLGGALMLAGVLVALSARRGPYSDPTEEETALGLAADPGLARLLDRALRNLSAARTAQSRDLPQPVVAWVSADRVTLNLAGGDIADPPAPWHLDGDDRSWGADLGEAAAGDAADRADSAAPFPGLLAVGRHDEYELFVDFEQAPGLISLVGDPELGRQLATALAVQAVTSLWSDGATAILVGFGDGAELAQLDGRSVRQVGHLRDALDGLTHDHDDLLALQRELGVDGVLQGRQLRRSSRWRPHLVVLSGPPTPDEAVRLQELCSGRSSVVVIVVGDAPAARWRFSLDASGALDLGVLGATAQAHRLDRDAVRRLVSLVDEAQRAARAASTEVASMTPHRALSSLTSPALGLAPQPALPEPSADATVSVRLLGPVGVDARGPVAAGRRELLTELVIAVALHPEGLHEAVLRASLWPRGVGDDAFAAAVSEASAWLGSDAAGRPVLHNDDGRWRLTSGARVDWYELRRLAESSGGGHEADQLSRAVAMFHGEAFSGTPAGRYGWLAFARTAREARVVGTAVSRRAAEVLLGEGRPDEAERVLREGLLLVPTAEVLWRELLRLAARRGPDGPAAAGSVADELYQTLARHRTWAEPETDALVAALAPERGVDRTG